MPARIEPVLCQNFRRIYFCAAITVVFLCGCGTRATISPENVAPSEEAVHFTNGDINLSGTLVLPGGSRKVPAVVLFHGSGPQPRNLFTARWFADHGFAALTYDKRGIGESTGNFKVVPFMELTGDGLAGVQYLKSRKEIDSTHIGVWGLSQGGWLGPLAASRSKDVAFVIAISGPGVSPGEQMLFFYAKDLEAKGLPEIQIREATALRRDIWNYMYTGNGYDQMEAEIKKSRTKPWYDQVKTQQDRLFEGIPTPAAFSSYKNKKYIWFRDEAQYDPVPTLEALRVPVLFIFGDQDRLVPVEKSVGIIRDALTRGGNKDFTIKILPNVDHGMYLPTGKIDPDYLDTMETWLAERAKNWR
jgi:dienelactone hydrolase